MLIDTCLGITVAYLGLSLGTQFFSKQKLNDSWWFGGQRYEH